MRKVLAIAAALVVVVLAAAVASAFVELPLERQVKELAGVEYGAPCPPLGPVELGRWRAEPPLPTVRDEARAARVGDAVYIAGGLASGRPLQSVDTFERYLLGERRYERLPPLPEAANHVGIAAHGGDVYVIGGFNERRGERAATGAAWRFRTAERRWQKLASMPTARGGLGLAVVGDVIYAAGGLEPGAHRDLATVEAFDVRTGTWSTLAPMPTPRDHLAVAPLAGHVYAAGGRHADDRVLAAFERYDPRTDRWQRMAPLPAPTSGIGMEAVGSRLVVAGGELPLEEQTRDGVWAFEPAAGWRRVGSLPIPKHGYAMASAGERLYVFGGSRCAGFNPVQTVESIKVGGS